ncbi:hypothetical protein QR680_013021 [Steinernema hermaphroditum]|uniref:Uncharacterized protein n=1 Tax=Steinernema hermaphroditum TaxID=289476 RepID=A0AA39I6Y4_9BILA|nr:hypothetical protein QR680_013021 [Steinernema hermaphroditum]
MRPSILIAFLCLLPMASAFCRRWSSEGRYCLEDRDLFNKTVVRVRRGVFGNMEYVWPDDEMMSLLASVGETFESVREIHFENNCNWVFGWRVGRRFAVPSLRLVAFDFQCASWSDATHHCVDVPAAWSRPQVRYSNVFVCDDKEEDGEEDGEACDGMGTVVEYQKDINRMLNNTLARALHLQQATERRNRELNRTLTEMEQSLHNCNALFGHLSRQAESLEQRLASCSEERSADRVLLRHYGFVLSRLRHELTYIFSFGMRDVNPLDPLDDL